MGKEYVNKWQFKLFKVVFERGVVECAAENNDALLKWCARQDLGKVLKVEVLG
jgi:hypothetical protein